MPSFNSATFVGNLTRDPELQYLPNGNPLVKCGIAVNHKRKDAKEEAMFMDLVLFGTSAETFHKHLQKGSCVLVEGRIVLDTWEAQDGTKRSRHNMVVGVFRFMDAAPKGGGTQSPGPKNKPIEKVEKAQAAQASSGPHNEDEIPF